jgi:hypothetical protein
VTRSRLTAVSLGAILAAAAGVGLAQPLGDEPDHHVVGHQRAGVHDALGLAPERRAGRHRLPQHLAGGDLRHAPLAGELARLGALAGAGRPEEDQPHPHVLRAKAPERDLERLRKPS